MLSSQGASVRELWLPKSITANMREIKKSGVVEMISRRMSFRLTAVRMAVRCRVRMISVTATLASKTVTVTVAAAVTLCRSRCADACLSQMTVSALDSSNLLSHLQSLPVCPQSSQRSKTCTPSKIASITCKKFLTRSACPDTRMFSSAARKVMTIFAMDSRAGRALNASLVAAAHSASFKPTTASQRSRGNAQCLASHTDLLAMSTSNPLLRRRRVRKTLRRLQKRWRSLLASSRSHRNLTKMVLVRNQLLNN